MANVLVVQATAHSSFPEATTATITGKDTTASGGANLIVLFVGTFINGTATPTDNQGNTYSPAAAERSTGGTPLFGRTFYCLNPTTNASHNFTVVATAGRPVLCMQAWKLANVTSSFDQENFGTSASSTTVSVGSLTNADASGISIAFYTSPYITADSIDTSYAFTNTDNVDRQPSGYGLTAGAVGYLNPSTGSAKNPTWTASGGSGTAMLAEHVTFRQDGGGGGGATVRSGGLIVNQAVKRGSYW